MMMMITMTMMMIMGMMIMIMIMMMMILMMVKMIIMKRESPILFLLTDSIAFQLITFLY